MQLVEYLKNFNDEDWFLKIDISKFFYSIPKHRLLKKYENIIKCKNTIRILKEFIFRNDFFNQGEMQVYIDDSLVYDSNPAFDVYSFLCVPDNKFPIIKVPLLKGVHKIKDSIRRRKLHRKNEGRVDL